MNKRIKNSSILMVLAILILPNTNFAEISKIDALRSAPSDSNNIIDADQVKFGYLQCDHDPCSGILSSWSVRNSNTSKLIIFDQNETSVGVDLGITTLISKVVLVSWDSEFAFDGGTRWKSRLDTKNTELFFSDDNISYKKCTSFVLERGEKSNIEGLPFWEFRFTKLHKYARYIKIHSKFKDDQWSWINYADRIIEVQGPNIKGTWFPSRRTTNKSYRNNFHFPPFGSTSCDAIVNSCNSSSSSCANASFDEKLFPVILQKLKSARILWHKIDYFDQNYLEPSEGVYNFALFDKIVSMHTIYGIQMLGSFNKLARWNAGKPNHAEWWHMEPADYNKYKDFVGVTVNRYKDQIKHWEGWNEINWQWTDQMGKMVDLQRCIYDGVKGADPNATVLCGGFSGTGIYQVERFISQGGGDYMDAFGGHFYARDPNASLKKTLAARGILDYYGYSGMPIWVTELGWSSGPWPELGSSIRVADETTKAKYLVKTLDLLLPHVQVFLWYSSVEPWTDPNQRMFGLLVSNAKMLENEAYNAYREYITNWYDVHNYLLPKQTRRDSYK